MTNDDRLGAFLVALQCADPLAAVQARPVLDELRAKAEAFDALEALAWSARVGTGIAIFPSTGLDGTRHIAVQDLGDEDGSNLGDELAVEPTLLAAVEAAKGGAE